MRRQRGRGHPVKLAWILAAILLMGSSAPAFSEGILSYQDATVEAPAGGSDPSDQTDFAKKPPTPTPTPSPAPSPSPTPSPDPGPSPSPTPEPSPEPTPKPTPDPTLQPSPEQTPAPSSSGVTGVLGPGSTSGSGSDASFDTGVGESTTGESLQDHPGSAPVDDGSSFIGSVASIIDQLAAIDVPVRASERGSLCRGSSCGSTADADGRKALALLTIGVILVVAGTSRVRAARRRPFGDPPGEDA
jgi:hypothetical protein